MHNSNSLGATQRSGTFSYLLILGALFFIFGFITWLNGALIPFLQIACELSHLQAYLVTMFFYIAYTVMALPVSGIIQRVGYKKGMSYGLAVMALGALIFIPAAYLRTYGLFLCGLFVLGSGLTLLQTASNPYVVLLGPKESAAARISFMGILNKSAGVVAPLLFSALVFSDMSGFLETDFNLLSLQEKSERLNTLSQRLISPYAVMAVALLVLSAMLFYSPLPEPAHSEGKENEKLKIRGLLKFPHLILGAVSLFFYVGAEVIAGDTIALFGKSLGVESFATLTSYTMAFMVIGYLFGILLIPRFISQAKALGASAVFGFILTLGILFIDPAQSWVSEFTPLPAMPDAIYLVALLGLANALVWPAVWPLALEKLGPYTSMGSALLIMGISGGAILPMLYGAVADSTSDLQFAYWILLPAYLFILFYAVKGHSLRR